MLDFFLFSHHVPDFLSDFLSKLCIAAAGSKPLQCVSVRDTREHRLQDLSRLDYLGNLLCATCLSFLVASPDCGTIVAQAQ